MKLSYLIACLQRLYAIGGDVEVVLQELRGTEFLSHERFLAVLESAQDESGATSSAVVLRAER
jgi:hypothetical protein